MQTGEVQREKPDFIHDQGPKGARAERPRGSRCLPTLGNETGMGAGARSVGLEKSPPEICQSSSETRIWKTYGVWKEPSRLTGL